MKIIDFIDILNKIVGKTIFNKIVIQMYNFFCKNIFKKLIFIIVITMIFKNIKIINNS
jgi:hypothetical protein